MGQLLNFYDFIFGNIENNYNTRLKNVGLQEVEKFYQGTELLKDIIFAENKIANIINPIVSVSWINVPNETDNMNNWRGRSPIEITFYCKSQKNNTERDICLYADEMIQLLTNIQYIGNGMNTFQYENCQQIEPIPFGTYLLFGFTITCSALIDYEKK